MILFNIRLFIELFLNKYRRLNVYEPDNLIKGKTFEHSVIN